MASEKEKALKLIDERSVMIETLNARLDKTVSQSQKELLNAVIEDFVDQLDTKNGKILNNARNQKLVALLDRTFNTYVAEHGIPIAKAIVDGTKGVLDFNQKYFTLFAEPAKLLPITGTVIDQISNWLGMEKGKVAKDGYLDVLVKADEVRLKIKDFAFGKVVNQAGLFETRKDLKALMAEDPENLGGLQKYYRAFTQDLYSTVDRTAAKITADKLELKYAIYEGGIIKTTRQFCKDRNGKVFTYDEIAEFDPPTAKQADYNPFTNLGGINCRHHLNWINKTVAFALRPDLKQ